MSESFVEGLRAQIGSRGGAQAARDPVNQPMIRHWCDAMEDHNPVYTDPAAAAKSVHGEIVAPPTMLNAWTMAGNIPRVAGSADPQSRLLQSLDAAGYSSVVATNSEHLYDRSLRIGAEVSAIVSEGAFDHLDGPVTRLAGPDVPAMPFSPPLEAMFMQDSAKIAEGIRGLVRY